MARRYHYYFYLLAQIIFEAQRLGVVLIIWWTTLITTSYIDLSIDLNSSHQQCLARDSRLYVVNSGG